MIDWVFFDVGNVLFNDAPQDFRALCMLHEAIAREQPSVTFHDILAERERLAREEDAMSYLKLTSKWLPPESLASVLREAKGYLSSLFDDHNLELPDVRALLETLSSQYRLGILANQPVECRSSLQRRDLLRFFDVVAISEELRIRKPDPRIFEWALNESASPASRCVMVGDRRDNDITPAAQAGMKTIWLRWASHHHKNWFPGDPRAIEFLHSCDRVPFFGEGLAREPHPMRVVESLADIPAALSSLDA